jgi:hypothetical protein
MEYTGVILFVALVVVQHWVTGRFLTELESDNPDKYKEVWPASESLLAMLFPFRFGLLYVIPGTYEYWSLGPIGLRLAKQLKVITWFVVAAILVALGLYFASIF